MKYTDPTGHFLDTVVVVISIGYDVYDIYNNGLNWENGLSLAADVASLAIPFVAGGGLAVRAVTKADNVLDVVTHADEAFDVVKYTDDVADAASHADDVGDIDKQLDNAPCPFNSFSAETPILTADGPQPIWQVGEGELGYAFNEATGQIELHPVTDTISHHDPSIVLLTLSSPELAEGSEVLETTTEHPFYVVEINEWLPLAQSARWVDAIDLRVGDAVLQADGETGRVLAVGVVDAPQRMYNLTVDTAHTFFVGDQQWLVHNCGPCDPDGTLARQGTDWEGTGRLTRKAAEAEAQGFPHGVSTTYIGDKVTNAMEGVSTATRAALEKVGFGVHNTPTRNDPLHHTIEPPKPVTAEIARLFNLAFGRSK